MTVKVSVPDFDPFGSINEAPPLLVQLAGDLRAGTLSSPLGLLSCSSCPARSESRHVVPGLGPATAQVAFIGQSPGDEEDAAALPFVGMAGVELDRWLDVLEFDRRKVFLTTLLKCHTKDNRVPRPIEITTCTNLWLKEEFLALPDIQILMPMGKPAAVRLLGKSAPPMTPLSVHHFRVRVGLLDKEVSVFPLPHPSYLLRSPHLGPLFRDTLLPQIRETLQREFQTVYDACRRH